MRQHVAAANRETGPVIEDATALIAQQKEVETKQQLLNAFNKHFILSDEEVDVLTSSGSAVDDRFFALLTRLKKINADCQVLLGSENQQLGLELTEKTSRHLNNAYQKLFRWVQKEFKTLDLENPRMNASIRRSLRVLAERPALFQNCLDFFAEARERNLSDAFYAALSGFSTQTDDKTAKPMDYYAHDSLRFAGDMLAWTHSAAVSERESLEVLFISEGDEMAKGIQAGIESEPWHMENSHAFDGRKSLEELVNRDMSGVARALRQRVEQAIKSDEDSVLAYKIANLIDFYRITFVRLLGEPSSILETLAALQESALNHYRTLNADHTGALGAETSRPPPDLDVPDFLSDALARLKELLKSYDSSFAPASTREEKFVPIIEQSFDPFLQACEQLAGQLSDPDSSIFTLNTIEASRATLSGYDFTSERVSELNDIADEVSARLIEYQHAFFAHTSGLHPLIQALAPLTDIDEDLKHITELEAFQPQALRDASQVLDEFLPSALIDAQEGLGKLRNKQLTEDVTAEAASRFCEDFELVQERLEKADSLMDTTGREQESLRSLFPRTSGEIRVLLS